jgi:hypothetical protein
MLKSGSIYFAIFISLIITIILGSLILCTFYSNRYTDMQIGRDQAISNVCSALILATKDTSILNKEGITEVNLFEGSDEPGRVTVQSHIWGLYRIITCTDSFGSFGFSKSALTGMDPESGEAISLYMADMDRYLSISGSTKLIGNCYLPKLGLRSAYIERQSFSGERLVDGDIKNSDVGLPKVDTIIIKANERYLTDNLPEEDSIIRFQEIERIDSIEQSFRSRTLTCYSSDPIILNNIILKGNIRIISARAIYVTEHFRSQDIILQAPKIFFNAGFKGSLQAFAADSLVAGEYCEFRYPSVLAILNRNINGVYLEIMKNTCLAGGVLLHRENKSSNTPFLKINNGVIIHGQVYWPGMVEIKGKIEGTLYCQSFVLHTPTALYDDFLMDVTINRKSLSPYFSFVDMVKGYPCGKEIKWLN